jgi:hypothetical protein
MKFRVFINWVAFILSAILLAQLIVEPTVIFMEKIPLLHTAALTNVSCCNEIGVPKARLQLVQMSNIWFWEPIVNHSIHVLTVLIASSLVIGVLIFVEHAMFGDLASSFLLSVAFLIGSGSMKVYELFTRGHVFSEDMVRMVNLIIVLYVCWIILVRSYNKFSKPKADTSNLSPAKDAT